MKVCLRAFDTFFFYFKKPIEKKKYIMVKAKSFGQMSEVSKKCSPHSYALVRISFKILSQPGLAVPVVDILYMNNL